MTDLLPCPFCGEAENLLREHMEGTILRPAYRIRCDNCGASINYTDRGDEAEVWNTRAHYPGGPVMTDDAPEAVEALAREHEMEAADHVPGAGITRLHEDTAALLRRLHARAVAGERLAEAVRSWHDPDADNIMSEMRMDDALAAWDALAAPDTTKPAT